MHPIISAFLHYDWSCHKEPWYTYCDGLHIDQKFDMPWKKLSLIHYQCKPLRYTKFGIQEYFLYGVR